MSETPSARDEARRFDRKQFVGMGAAAAATPMVAGALARTARAAPFQEIEEATITQLQAQMAGGGLTSHQLVQKYLTRIDAVDRRGGLNSILEVNPEAEAIAKQLDAERRAGRVRGPLHGIPITLKGNIDTGDKMQTTAGSLALVGAPAPQDSTVAKKLRDAGAVILGKTNLSEWANFRGFNSSSGWSGQGGQNNLPYVLDRNPCGSSSGSAASVSANLCTAGLGTETDGSIVCPANHNAVVGIKPTVGLTSRAGVIPIAASQDTVGPHGRTVADAAAVLSAIVSRTADPRDPATSGSPNGGARPTLPADYTQFVDPNGLRGVRIGVMRTGVTGYSDDADRVFEEAIDIMRGAGAVIVDPADLPDAADLATDISELVVLVYEFKRDLNAYLATRTGIPVHTMADVIQFNLDHFEQELKWFGQEWFELAEAKIFSDAEYAAAKVRERQLGGALGIDAALSLYNVQALVAPTDGPSWPSDLVNGDHFLGASSGAAAQAGYPIINVPSGNAFGLPLGISFMASAFSEPTLIKLASGFEAAAKARQVPQFLPTLPVSAPTRRGSSKSKKNLPGRSRPAVFHL
jgi:amidase